ncbi:MAG TPA: helix-turn-helix transcriptional regulator [Polyangiaceae bacterium]|jgi:DNA-binding CsgD family transcriptional regulator|nr:helix-turn-helix transcriptional regulator [Polyangiaceae bacterium]
MSLNEAQELIGNFAELIVAERDPARLWPAMLRRVEQAVGFDAGYIAASFGPSTEGRGAVLEHDAQFLKLNLGRFLAEISLEEVARYTERARAHEEVWSEARQRELAVFQEVLFPTNMTRMAVRVSVRQGNVAGFNLERRGRCSPFSEAQLGLIDLAGPFLHIVELLTVDSEDDHTASNLASEYSLSKRESELVGLVTRGLQNSEIGMVLGVSANTVRNTLVRVFEKVGVTNRAELAYHATNLSKAHAGRFSSVEPGSIRDDGTAQFTLRVREAAASIAPPPQSTVRPRSSSEIVYAPPLAKVTA